LCHAKEDIQNVQKAYDALLKANLSRPWLKRKNENYYFFIHAIRVIA
jgi:hypothetical protein